MKLHAFGVRQLVAAFDFRTGWKPNGCRRANHVEIQSDDESSHSKAKRDGAVILVVLVVIVILSLSAYTFTNLMLGHRQVSRLGGRQVQTQQIVESGVEAIRLFLAHDEADIEEAGGTYDNPPVFQGVLVVPDADPNLRGRYTVIAPALDEEGYTAGLRYGLEDESTRVNLNALLIADNQIPNGGRDLLLALPGMTEEIADAIMDWIDEDDEPREFGAELEYYSSLDPPYAPKNGPLETVEELLLVRGIRENPFLLFGADPYRNGIPIGMPGTDSTSASTSSSELAEDPALLRGWASQFTLYSQEHNVNATGLKRINVNQEDMQTLYDELRTVLNDEWSTYIVAYRQGMPAMDSGQGVGGSGGKLDLTLPGQTPLAQVLDIVDTEVSVRFEGDSDATILRSPIQSATIGLHLPLLMDNLSTSDARTLPGRININQASRSLLLGIPGMDEEVVEQIISRRDIVSDDLAPNRRFETWILAEGIVDLPTMKTLLPFVSVGGDVYRAQVIGYFQGGGVQSRSEVVLDATTELPGILFWRDISHLPHGYPIEVLGVDFGEEGTAGALPTPTY